MRSFFVAALSILGSIAVQNCVLAQSARSDVLSGSNFFWYDLSAEECAVGRAAAARDRYAVIAAYGTPEGRLAIDRALVSMRQKGQQVIALGLFHQHGGHGKSILDSTGGRLSTEAAANLSALIDTIIKLDFRVVYLRFFPFGENYAPVTIGDTPSLKSDLYQENLSFIESALHLASGKRIRVITDLCNECSPGAVTYDNKENPLQARLMFYTRQLWKDYVQMNGPENTVGFSIIPDKFRVANLPAVYGLGGVRPGLLDFHFYPSATELELMKCRSATSSSECQAAKACLQSPTAVSCHPIFAGSLFDDLTRQLLTIGFNTPWIVGETYYNDPNSATYFKMGMASTHQQLLYIFQWPLVRTNESRMIPNGCSEGVKGGGVDVATPLDIDAYLNIKSDR